MSSDQGCLRASKHLEPIRGVGDLGSSSIKSMVKHLGRPGIEVTKVWDRTRRTSFANSIARSYDALLYKAFHPDPPYNNSQYSQWRRDHQTRCPYQHVAH
ncbi:hypothetical protein NL676_025123 [Syzygium grande]|nr:hypothetical protein NL676_025123 [Syzygium grande]